MIDLEKAMELFGNHDTVKFILTGVGDVEYDTIEFEDVYNALEKQIPKKPIEKENGWYYCPTCNTKVPASANYCCGYYNDKQGCGQALKW